MTSLGLIVSIAALGAAPAAEPARVELPSGYYLHYRPANIPAEAPLPLIICLHGTETSSADILRFWRGLSARLPLEFVAPQGAHAGWRASDSRLLRETIAHVTENLVYDHERVLLTGHSAGGAMAFRLLYVEGVPATAVAVTANYLPPNITSDQARARADVPVFYAVGTRDLNRNRMRAGVALLREAGVTITMRRPRIGHRLDRAVGQQAMEWFEQRCRERVQSRITRAESYQGPESSMGLLAAELEAALQYPETQFEDQLAEVRAALGTLEAPARRTLAMAKELAAERKYFQALGLYSRVERSFNPASLAEVARACRIRLEADPNVIAARSVPPDKP